MLRTRRPLLALIALVLLLVIGYVVKETTGSSDSGSAPSSRSMPASGLPAQARQTIRLIQAGGPYPYHQDGTVFANRQHRLPAEPSGYYREYTVPTPGESDRGARRIVIGRHREYFYTADHYDTFRRVQLDH